MCTCYGITAGEQSPFHLRLVEEALVPPLVALQVFPPGDADVLLQLGELGHVQGAGAVLLIRPVRTQTETSCMCLLRLISLHISDRRNFSLSRRCIV